MTALTRLLCRTCSEETLHRKNACVHCGTMPEVVLRPDGQQTPGRLAASRAARAKARYQRKQLEARQKRLKAQARHAAS